MLPCKRCEGTGKVIGDCLDSPNIWYDPCPDCHPEEAKAKEQRIRNKQKRGASVLVKGSLEQILPDENKIVVRFGDVFMSFPSSSVLSAE